MATNIEEILRSFVVSKFREIQGEQQQQHGGGNVEAQPNGDTAPAEPAQPSDASGAAGSCAGDQMVQKIEEVLSGALGTELQSNPDVDKNTVKNSTQSTKRSSTGEDEIPRKKAKKNKKHKSKKKKKKKKKRKKEKKHKKQPKEAKLGARPGEAADVPPAPHLLLEKSGSQVNVQQGGVGEPSLAGHLQPQLCPTASEGLDNQALGLVSHSVTDSQQSAENLGSGEGTLCAANPPFNLESNQSNIPENTSIAHSTICTSEEQIQQSHGNIYPVAINASVVDTGNDAWSSIPSGTASKSEFQKDSVEALRGSEVTLKSPGTEEVKALDAALEPEAMEVLPYSEASLQSVSQRGAQDLGTASESVSLASGGTAIPTSANWADPSAVTVAHVAVAGQVQKIPEATEKCVHMGNVQSVQRSLELGGVSRTLEPAQQPSVIAGNLSMTLPMGSSSVLRANVPLQHPFKLSAASPLAPVDIQSAKTPLGAGATTKMKDIEPAMENVKASETTLEPVGVTAPESLQSKSVEGPTAPAAVLGAAGAFLQRGVFPEARGVDRAVGPVLPAAPTGASVAAEPEGGRAAAEPTALGQALVQQTAPQLHVAEGLRSPQARGSEGTSLPRPEGESNVRGLAPAPSLQKEDVQGLGGVLRPVAFTAASLALQGEGVKASEQTVHCGAVASPGLALGRTPEPVVACESVEPVREALSGVMPWQTTAEREPLSANQTQSSITSQTQVMAHTRTSQVEVHGERRDSELAPEDPSKAEARSREAALEPVQALETSLKPVQEQIVGLSTAVLESLPRVEENNVTELTDVQTQGPAVEYLLGTRTSMQRNEPSEMEKAKYLGPAPEAGEVGWLESMKESATVEVKDSGTGGELEVAVDDASAAVPESLHTEKPEELQEVLEVKPAAEWKSSEEAPEILGAAGLKSSEAVPKPGDVKGLETTQEHTVTAEVQYAEGVQGQQVEDMLIEKEDAEQTQPSEPIAETVLSSSPAAEEKDSTVTPEAGTQDSEAAPQADVELKDAAAVGSEAEAKDLEATPVPETEAEAAQAEVIPETEDVKEATPEEDSEKRDSETSDVQPDVAARMKETLMRLENVVEKSSHRSSEKKHDSKKQKRSRSKSQSRSRKRKKKSRSRSTSRRLTSKRARSRSRNYSVSRKKHSKSRSRSMEKRERRVSSRRSRRRRSRSSDRYRSKSRSAEKRLSSGRSRRRRSRSSDHYRSKSRSAEKRLSSRRSRRRRSRSSDRYRSKSRSVEKRLSSRRSGRRRSRSSDRYRSKSRSVEKRLSSRRSGRRRSRSSDRYRSKSRSVEKRLSSRRSGRRRSRSSDRYRSKSRSVEKRLSSRRSGRRRSRSSDRYRSKSRSVEKRLSSWRSRRRHSRSSDRSKSRSRSSEKGGGKEYSWRFRHRSGSSDRSKSRSRSVEKRGRKASVRRSKRQRSKSSDRYKSRSRSVEKRDRKQSSRKSKRQRSKSSDRYKSRSKSVEKKKESSRKSKRRRSKSSERYKSRSRSVEKKRKESSKKSKRKRSKSSDSVKSRSKSVEKRENKLSAKSSKHAESSELQESTKSLENVPESSVGSEGKSSNGPMSMSLSEQGINGPELPPSYGSGFSKTSDNLEESSSSVEKTDLQSSAMSEMDTSKTPDNQELRSMSVEKTQDSELSMTSENGSTEKAEALESSPLPELPYSTPKSRSSSVEKRRDAETSSAAEFHLSTSHGDVSRTAPLREVEGPELPPSLLSDYKTISSSSGSVEAQGSSVPPEGTLSNSSDGPDSRHIPGEQTELPQFLQGPEHGSSQLAASPGAVEAQRPSLAPEGTHPAIPDGQEPSLASDSGYFMSPDGRGSGSCFATPVDQPSLSVGESFKSPDGNEQRYLSVEKVKAADVSLTSVCGSVEISDDLVSVSSFKVHESRSSVDKGLDGPTLPQVLEVDCSRSSEMHESRYLPAGKIDGAGSLVLSKSGISVCHDGHKAKYNSFESTEGAELSVASELRCSVFPEGYKLASAAVDKVEIHKSPLSLEGGFSVSADGESVSTPEKLQPPGTALPSEEGVVLLPDNHELRPVPAEKVEVLNSSELKVLASPDSYRLGSAHDEIQVQESRCSVASDGHEVTSTPFGRAEVEEPSGVSDNEHTIGLDGPELTSTPAEKTELRKLYQMAEERSLVSAESQELQAPSAEKAQMEEPALGSDSECTVSWLHQELRSSSPKRAEVQEAAVVPDSDYAVAAEHHTLPSSLAAKPEGQECSVLPGVSPQGQEVMASPAEKEVQEPSLPPGSEYSIFPRGQGLQPGLAGNMAVQEPSPIPDSCYTASPGGLELLHAYNETPEVQECSLLSENEYDVSPERRDLRSSPAEKEEGEESESESSISTDSRELQPAAVGKTEVQELSLSEGECPMSPEGQELQSSPAERIEAKEPSVTSENEHTLSSEEYEPRVTHTERAEGADSALASERDHLFFESQEVRFPPLQKAAGQELSPAPDNEHGASPAEQELRFTSVGKADDLEPLALNDRASMSPDDRDLKSIPVEKVDHAMPSLLPEGERSVSPDGYSVRSGPGEETGDLEPSLRSERRYSTSSYQEGHELKSPMEEEGLESSLTSEHRRSVSPEGHDRKSAIDEEMDDVERRSTSPEEQESSAGEEAEDLEQPLTTERRCSVSSDEHESRSTTGEEAEDAEPSLTAERRDSISSDEHESRSTAGEDGEDGEASVTAERRHSTSSDDRESTAGEETEDLTAEHRRSVSPDGRESRSSVGEEAEDQELSLTAERRHSTSSDDHESRSTAGEDAEDVEPSSAAERRDSTSSDEQESRSDAGEEAEDVEPSLTAEHRRSASPDGAESRSTTGEEEGDDAEPSLTAEQRDSTSSEEHESESSSGEEEGEDAEPSLADEDKQDSMPLEQSEEQDSSFVPESRRSESSEREKSRSKSVDKASDKESPQRSVSRRSQSPALQKSRSTSVEKAADKETTRRYRRRRSRSTAHQRSQSTSVEKTADKESTRRSRRRRSRSTARQRSQSKSVEKAADKESSRRSRSRRSRSSQRRSKRYDTDSRSRRNRSRSATRRRASRSKSNRRSRSSSLSRSRHRRRSRSRSASRRRRSLSRDRRKRSQRNRSRSTERRRRRSDSRDRRISLRLRSRSRTPLRQRRSRSRGRRRSSSRSPIRLRRSRSSGRRRYSRSPDRRRSRSSEFSSRSPKRLTDLDKAQLLEIAKANAAAMCAKSGVPLPPSLMPLLSQKKDDKANQKSSRDTLKELTEKCKKIAQSTDDVIVNKPHVSDEEEEERPFYNHPFKLSEPKPIFFNLSTPSIKPAPPPQPKNQVSLSKEFPVSSGSQHRKKEADSVYGEWVPVDKGGKDDGKDDVFPKPAIECVDITTAMNDRAVAQKRLNENSFDLEAMCMLNRAQEQIDAWAQSNSIPGQFTGSTGAQILSSDELTNSGPQAWIRKDQFLRAAPVTGGMGAQLMRKMGWREGEGLGKNKEGSVEPIMVDFKTDRKGLVAVGEKAQKRSGHYVVMKDLSGKHPVSALMEICNKRRWTPPEFVLVDDSGPDHRKHFIFKVRVNGNEYRPTFASLNKKHAKATAATAALQAMGLVPKESMVNTTMFRSASHR